MLTITVFVYKGGGLFKWAVVGKAKVEEFDIETISAVRKAEHPPGAGQLAETLRLKEKLTLR